MAKIWNRFASDVANEYIEEYLGKKTEYEIIKHLRGITNLSVNTIKGLYIQVLNERYENSKNQRKEKLRKESMEKKNKTMYKGRERSFLYFNDSELYKKVGI